jgi:DNA modification methylase
MQTQLVKIKDLKNNTGQVEGLPKNPRILKDDKFIKLKKSLEDDPEMLQLREVIAYDNKGELIVICGNMRLKALKELGIKEVPTKILPTETSVEKLKAYTIKDNVSFGDHDWELLANEWDNEELEAWGLDIPNFETDEVLEATEDDFDSTPPEEPITVLGDLYEIGEHRLLCGDSTDSDAVAKLMDGNKIDLVFTDPPYGISVVQGSKVGGNKGFGSVGGGKIVKAKNYSQIIGDDTTDTARDFYNTCISLGMENFIIWGGNYFTDFLNPSMCWIVWDKENTGNFADVELAWTSFQKGAKLYKWQWNGMIRKGDKSIEGKTRVHPTQKPVGLFNDIFKDFPFYSCFDGFLGSGSTMVASHQLKRKCYGMELDPKYCDVIVKRMLKLDDTLTVKRNGVDVTNEWK